MVFNLNLFDIINIVFIAAGLGICGLSIIQVGSGVHIRKEVRGYFQIFFTLINIYISMHLIRMLVSAHPGKVFSVLIQAATFVEFTVSGFMIYLLALLILFLANPGKIAKVINYIFLFLLAGHVIGLIANIFSKFYYYFDAIDYTSIR